MLTRYTFIKIVLLALPLFGTATSQAYNWEQRSGNMVDSVEAMLIAESGRLLIAMVQHGVLASEDTGKTWVRSNIGIESPNLHTLLPGTDPNTFFCSTVSGSVYYSSDEGATWEFRVQLPAMQAKYAYAQDGTIFAWTSNFVSRRRRGEDQWTEVYHGVIYDRVSAVVIAPNGDLLLGTHWAGVYRSTDFGERWNHEYGAQVHVENMWISPKGYIFALFDGTGYWSTDSGIEWKRNNPLVSGRDNELRGLYFTGEMDALATRQGGDLLVSTDAGSTWSVEGNVDISYPVKVGNGVLGLLHRRTLDSPLAGFRYRSESAEPWVDFNPPVWHDNVIGFASLNDSRILAATEGGVAVTADRGVRWQPYGGLEHLGGIYAIHRNEPSHVWIFHTLPADTTTMTCTTDGGATWTARAVPMGDIVRVSSTGSLAITGYQQINVSHDNGTSWSQYPLEFRPRGLTFTQSGGLLSGGFDGVHYSSDDGGSWSLQNPAFKMSNNLQLGPDGIPYSFNYYNVVHSMDNGVTWDSIPLLGEGFISDKRVLAFTEEGSVFLSGNTGLYTAASFDDEFTRILDSPLPEAISAIYALNQEELFIGYHDPTIFPDDIPYYGVWYGTTKEPVHAPRVPHAERLDIAAFPNPFSAATELRFSLDSPESIVLDIYNVVGERVAEVANGRFQSGTHTIGWNGNRTDGLPLPPGLYMYRFSTGSEFTSGKIIKTR